jgi:hypothetical protein
MECEIVEFEFPDGTVVPALHCPELLKKLEALLVVVPEIAHRS